jgi:hypothetical protein
MNHPDVRSNLERVDNPEGIASEREGDFQNARPKTLQWFSGIRFTALSGDCERGE